MPKPANFEEMKWSFKNLRDRINYVKSTFAVGDKVEFFMEENLFEGIIKEISGNEAIIKTQWGEFSSVLGLIYYPQEIAAE